MITEKVQYINKVLIIKNDSKLNENFILFKETLYFGSRLRKNFQGPRGDLPS